MAKGRKTGGRTKGVGNRDQTIKNLLRAHSVGYYTAEILVEDEDMAKALCVPVGAIVSRFDIDVAAMRPAERATIEEKLLRYHTPQMQSVSAQVDVGSEDVSLEMRLRQLANGEK